MLGDNRTDNELMSVQEVFDLRKKGATVAAYELARSIYAVDKGPYASAAMFWAAVDMLQLQVVSGQQESASKILKALERLLPGVPDPDGCVEKTYRHCGLVLQETGKRQNQAKSVAEHTLLGRWGEEQAAAYLRGKGYAIIEHDWQSKHRDIDLIALHNGTTVFVEVKTRRDTRYTTPEQAVDWRKRLHLRRAINHYLHYRKINSPTRFDIISVVGVPGNTPVIKHIEDVEIMT